MNNIKKYPLFRGPEKLLGTTYHGLGDYFFYDVLAISSGDFFLIRGDQGFPVWVPDTKCKIITIGKANG